jgi:hypothetical protein
MLSLLPFVAVLVTAPAAAPTDAPAPTPLTEIGRVQSAPICTPIVVHANGAITSALDNDRTLAIINHNLRAIDFDRLNEIQRNNAIDNIMNQAAAVRQSGKAADKEIKQLRAYAAASSDPQRQKELKTFADALGGAIQRQSRAAEELMRDVMIAQGRDEAQDARDARDATGVVPETTVSMNAANATANSIMPGKTPSYTAVMRQIAADLTDRSTGIGADEGVAADHSIAATSGC